jgi:hypothetical protein
VSGLLLAGLGVNILLALIWWELRSVVLILRELRKDIYNGLYT